MQHNSNDRAINDLFWSLFINLWRILGHYTSFYQIISGWLVSGRKGKEPGHINFGTNTGINFPVHWLQYNKNEYLLEAELMTDARSLADKQKFNTSTSKPRQMELNKAVETVECIIIWVINSRSLVVKPWSLER